MGQSETSVSYSGYHPSGRGRQKDKKLGGDKVRTGRQKREIERAIVEKTKKTKVKVRLWVDGSG